MKRRRVSKAKRSLEPGMEQLLFTSNFYLPKKLEFVVAVADINWVAAYQTGKKFIWRIVLE